MTDIEAQATDVIGSNNVTAHTESEEGETVKVDEIALLKESEVRLGR